MKNILPFFLAAAVLCSCQQQSMERALAAKKTGFQATEAYAAYVKKHGERAEQLRRTAAKAATMRVHFTAGLREVDESHPLTRKEVKAVREILAQIDETPAHDEKLWLTIEYDREFGPWPCAPFFWATLEFVAADGHVLDSFREFDSVMVDAVQAEAYRGARYCPAYMLPSDSLQRWNALPFFSRAQKRCHELFRAEGLMRSDVRVPAAVFQSIRL